MTLPELLNAIFTEDVVKFLATGAGAFLLYLVNKLKTERARKLTDQLVDAAVSVAYTVVENRARQTPGKLDDKAALGLQVLRDYLRTKGVELTEDQAERAKLLFESMHAHSLPSTLFKSGSAKALLESKVAFNAAPVDAYRSARKINGG